MMLIEGHHWRHFPGDCSDLAIFYHPANTLRVGEQSPRLPYYLKTAGMACGRILINPGNNNYYQDCQDSLAEIVVRISEGYERTIHYGYSQGATGALDQGMRDQKCCAIFAISPHFVLDRPASRSEDLMDSDVLASARPSLVERLSATETRGIHLFMSVRDAQDGVQVRDSLSLPPYIAKHYICQDHYLGSVNVARATVEQWLSTQDYHLPEGVPIANDEDIKLAPLIYDALVAQSTGAELPQQSIRLLDESASGDALYWLGRYQNSIGETAKATVLYQRAIDAGVLAPVAALVCLGNAHLQLDRPEIALGCYRQALVLNPTEPTARKCEQSLLEHMGRQGVGGHNVVTAMDRWYF
jgi:hypothetical protein